MIELLILVPLLISFFVTLFLIRIWIRKATRIGLVWEDMNKMENPKIPGSGGIVVILSFFSGVLSYIAYRVFFLGSSNVFLVEIFALLTVSLFLGGLGFVDDLMGWKMGGIRKRHRLILVALAAVPLISINAGKSTIAFPFMGVVDLGLIYPIFLIPLGIVGVTTTFNFLAGFNGVEAGQGIIMLSSLALVAYLTGSPWLAIIALCMVASLCAFLFYNFYPAKIFPGDSLTYPVGGLIAIMAILGNFERIAFFFFVPFIIETVLKLRGGLLKQSFGLPKDNGELELKYKKIYSLNHFSILLMKKLGMKPTEKKVVYFIWGFQLIIIILGFLIFGRSLELK